MEPTPTYVLIIDDHSLITEAYKFALYLEEESEKYKFFINVCHNCSDADAIIRITAAYQIENYQFFTSNILKLIGCIKN